MPLASRRCKDCPSKYRKLLQNVKNSLPKEAGYGSRDEWNDERCYGNVDTQRFCHRSGSALVPRVWRLLHPGTNPEGDARVRGTTGEDCLYLWYWVFQPLPLLYAYVWLPHHSRPCTGHCHGTQGQPARSDGLGDHG